jgi:hypothetical protein
MDKNPPGYLWTIYTTKPAPRRRGRLLDLTKPRPPALAPGAQPDSAGNFRALLFASVRTWRYWHPGASGAICDHDQSLSDLDRAALRAPPFSVDIYEPCHTSSPALTVNKLFSLVDSPWERTVHADHDVIWTADSNALWDEAPTGVDFLSLGQHWRPPVEYVSPGSQVPVSPVQPGTADKLWPCANLFLCQGRRPAQLILDGYHPTDSDESAMARAEGANLITCETFAPPPRYFCQFIGDRNGWHLAYYPEEPLTRRWVLTNAITGAQTVPIALHLGGIAGKRRFTDDPNISHYLAAIP